MRPDFPLEPTLGAANGQNCRGCAKSFNGKPKATAFPTIADAFGRVVDSSPFVRNLHFRSVRGPDYSCTKLRRGAAALRLAISPQNRHYSQAVKAFP
jgi:hypothetical protein